MNIPQEKEILLDIPSHNKMVPAGFSKSPALVEANGSFVISPHRKPNRLKPGIFDVFKTSRHEHVSQFMSGPFFQNIEPLNLNRMGSPHELVRRRARA